jgi:hypothetical protein
MFVACSNANFEAINRYFHANLSVVIHCYIVNYVQRHFNFIKLANLFKHCPFGRKLPQSLITHTKKKKIVTLVFVGD